MATGKTELDATASRWSDACGRRDWQSAFEIAIQGYKDSKNNLEYRLMFLGLIRQLSGELFDNDASIKTDLRGTDLCSFCLSNRSDLVRGTKAAICLECAVAACNALNKTDHV